MSRKAGLVAVVKFQFPLLTLCENSKPRRYRFLTSVDLYTGPTTAIRIVTIFVASVTHVR